MGNSIQNLKFKWKEAKKLQKIAEKESIESDGTIVDENDRKFNGDVEFTGTVTGIETKIYRHHLYISGPSGNLKINFYSSDNTVVSEDNLATKYSKWIGLFGHALGTAGNGACYIAGITYSTDSIVFQLNFESSSTVSLTYASGMRAITDTIYTMN